MPDTSALPAEDVLGSLLAGNVSAANGGNPAVSLNSSKRAGTYVELFSGITAALTNFQQGTAAIAGADKALTDMRQANAEQMAQASGAAAVAAGNIAATNTARENEYARLNAASLAVTGDDINDPNSRINKQMQLSNQHVDAAQASLETYMKKSHMSLGSVIFGDTSIGDLIDANLIHPKEGDLEDAKIHAGIAASAEGNIKDIESRYTGALQSNKAVANVLHLASEADARVTASTADLLKGLEARDKSYMAGADRLRMLTQLNSDQFHAVTAASSARTSIISQQRQDEREAQRLHMDKIREAKVAAGTITMDDQVATIKSAYKLLGKDDSGVNAGYIKTLSMSAGGKQRLADLTDIAVNAATDLSNPATPTNWVGTPGHAAVLEADMGVNLLGSTPGAKVLTNELAKWKSQADATVNGKRPTRAQFAATVNSLADAFVKDRSLDNLDNEVTGKTALKDVMSVAAFNSTPALAQFRDTILKPLAGTDGSYVDTGVIAAGAVQSNLPTATIVAGLKLYGQVAGKTAAARVAGNRVGLDLSQLEPAAWLPTTGVFSSGKTSVKFNDKELINYVTKERNLGRMKANSVTPIDYAAMRLLSDKTGAIK